MIANPKTTLFQTGDSCTSMYLVQSGRIFLFRETGSKYEKAGSAGPGDMLAVEEFLGHRDHQHLAVVAEPTELQDIDRNSLEKEMQELPPELGKVLRNLSTGYQNLMEASRRQTVCNALPCLLFVLNSFLDANRAVPYRVADIADQMESLYGIAYQDFCELLFGFSKLELSSSHFDEHNVDFLQIDNAAMLRRLYQYFQDRASPSPREGVILTKAELQALQCLVLAQTQESKNSGDRVKVPFTQLLEVAKQNAQDARICSRALSSLSLNGIIQAVPNLGADLNFTPQHHIAFKLDEIKQLLDLNLLVPKATTDFWQLCQTPIPPQTAPPE